MKIVILAGGLGTRISEYTKIIPKPMIKVNKRPLIYYIMKHYANYGFKDFYIALGYKGHIIKKYFEKKNFGWNINLIDTGQKTMTGGRLKRLKRYLGNEPFMLTYGDGLSNVNIEKLLKFHKKNNAIATLTAVHPPVRFGEIKFNKEDIKSFVEKPQAGVGWINGGFFVLHKRIFDYISSKKTVFEKEPMINLTKKKKLFGYKHEGFWQCMDTKRDMDNLNITLKKNNYFE